MTQARLLRLPPPDSPADTAWAIATLKRRLRARPPMAVAAVIVQADGAIELVHGGGPSGWQHQLAAATALLHKRVMEGYDP